MDNIKILYSAEPTLTIPMIKLDDTLPIAGKRYDEIATWMDKNNIHAFSTFTDDMPDKFQKCRPIPKFIYAIGDISLLSRPMLGIVGPRKNSAYADQIVQSLLETAKQYDMVTVSGMARGVDSLCHRYSIKNAIPTIAVLGGGLKRYKESNRREQISSIVEYGGLVISEFKLELEPNKYTFPQRNRIIAGLSDVVFLPEANEKSGSLITAKYAINTKTPVYVAPNSLFENTSKGTNALLKENRAKPIDTNFGFLATHFRNIENKINTAKMPELGEKEKQVYLYLDQKGTADSNQITIDIGIETSELLNIVTVLELQGLIYEKNPYTYSICK